MMETISIEFPTEIFAALQTSPEELKRDLALTWYRQGKISLAQAQAISPLEIEASAPPQLDLNEFLNWASHDLKTPLNAVIGFSKVVLKGIDGPINELQTTDLGSVHTNGQKMLFYLNLLVDAARLNRGDIHLTREEVEIAPLAEETLLRWKSQNPAKEAFFLSLIAPNISPKISGEAARLRQMLSNLLSLTALHLESEGRLTLEMEAPEMGGLTFQIRSTGLRARAVPHVEAELMAFVAGGLITLHGGRIESLQEEPNGARVRFWLPAI